MQVDAASAPCQLPCQSPCREQSRPTTTATSIDSCIRPHTTLFLTLTLEAHEGVTGSIAFRVVVQPFNEEKEFLTGTVSILFSDWLKTVVSIVDAPNLLRQLNVLNVSCSKTKKSSGEGFRIHRATGRCHGTRHLSEQNPPSRQQT